jgi:hypothetical protein
MRNVVRGLAILMFALQAACSTAGGMYTANDPVNGDFSVWKTAGAVLLGVLTLGAIGVGAYAGASSNHGTTYVNSDEPVFVSGDSYHRTYYYKGQYINCYRTGSFVNCY